MTAWFLQRRERWACAVPSQQQELWWAACGTGSGIYFRNCALCQAWGNSKPKQNVCVCRKASCQCHSNKRCLWPGCFVWNSFAVLTYNSHSWLKKMKTLLEGMCVGGVCLFWVAWGLGDFWWRLGGVFSKKTWQCDVKYSMAFVGCIGFILTDPWGTTIIIPLLQ